jgi:hypothetical protein
VRSVVVPRLALLASSLFLIECGRGSSGSRRVGASAAITFPSRTSMTDASSITVRGRTTGATEVAVNDVPATSGDGFATFTANVPLVVGTNRIAVDFTDSNGLVHADAAVVDVIRADSVLLDPIDVAVESTSRLLLIDATRLELLRVDTATGTRTVLSGPTIGSGPMFVAPTALTAMPSGNDVLVADLGRILAVDRTTGERRIVADDSGDGPALGTIRDLAPGTFTTRVFVASATSNAILDLDLITGDRTVVSGPLVGSGLLWSEPTSFTVAPGGTFVVDQEEDVLFRVDPLTGDRTIVASDAIGTGPSLDQPVRVRFAPLLSRLLVTSRGGTSLLSVDPLSGSRSVLSGPGVGGGPAFVDPLGLAAPANGSSVFLVEHGPARTVERVDLSTGDRTVLFSLALGTGAPFAAPVDVDLDLNRNRLVVLDAGADALVAVSLANGNRGTISANVGGGAPGIAGTSLALDPGFNRALVPMPGELVAVNLTTGVRTVLSSITIGSGPLFLSPSDLVLDAPNARVFLVESSPPAVFVVNLATGDRAIVSDSTTGSGPLFSSGDAIALDPTMQRVLVLDGASARLVAVDFTTGDRAVLVGVDPGLQDGESLDLDRPRARAFASQPGKLNVIETLLAKVSVVSEDGAEPGPPLSTVTGLRYDASRDAIFTVSPFTTSAMLVDVVTGERVIVSK